MNEIEFEDDIQGDFGYIMPGIAYMLGDDTFFISIGLGYGIGIVNLKKQSSKAKKHLVSITYEDGNVDQYSLEEFNVEYGSPFDDTNGLVGAYVAFLEFRFEFLYLSVKQGNVTWTDDKVDITLENIEFRLGLMFDFW